MIITECGICKIPLEEPEEASEGMQYLCENCYPQFLEPEVNEEHEEYYRNWAV